MSEIGFVSVGTHNADSFHTSDALEAWTGVRAVWGGETWDASVSEFGEKPRLVRSGDEIGFAGDASGRVLQVKVAFGQAASADPAHLWDSQAQRLLTAIQGDAYSPFEAQNAAIDPAAEIGDAVSLPDGALSMIFSMSGELDGLCAVDISAPTDEAVDSAYPSGVFADSFSNSEDSDGINVAELAEALPEALPEAWEQTLAETLPELLPEALAETLPNALPEALPEVLPNALTEILPEILPDILAETLPDAWEDTLLEILPNALTETLPEVLPNALTEALPEILPDALAEALPEALAETLPNALPEALPEVLPNALTEILPEILPDILAETLPDAWEDTLQEILPNVLTETLPEVLPGALTEILPEILPDALAEALPDAWEETLFKTLYASNGLTADLIVNSLSTTQAVRKRLAGDTSEDRRIEIREERIAFVAGLSPSGAEHATNPHGELLYWASDPHGEGVTTGSDGYPYFNGERILITTDSTEWPVSVYDYTDQTKLKIAFEQEGTDSGGNPIYTPTITLGAGNANGYNQAVIRKGAEGLEILYTANTGGVTGLRFTTDGRMTLLGGGASTLISLDGTAQGTNAKISYNPAVGVTEISGFVNIVESADDLPEGHENMDAIFIVPDD